MRYARSDFDSLSVGQVLRSSGRTVTEADVVAFAALTGDRHPVHVDAVWASRSAFGQRIAHGMLILSYAVGLAPMDPALVLALRSIRQATFKAPAHIGDTLVVVIEITEVRPLTAELGMLSTTWRILNQDDRLLARVCVDLLCKRAPSPRRESRATASDGVEVDIASIPV